MIIDTSGMFTWPKRFLSRGFYLSTLTLKNTVIQNLEVHSFPLIQAEADSRHLIACSSIQHLLPFCLIVYN